MRRYRLFAWAWAARLYAALFVRTPIEIRPVIDGVELSWYAGEGWGG